MKVTNFRYSTETDLPLLAELNRELMADERDTQMLSIAELEERMDGWLREGHRALLFENEGHVLGYVLYCIGERLKGKKLIFLRHFLVKTVHRRQGIGREVFDYLFHKLWPPNLPVFLDVKCDNTAGRAFWKALGFEEDSITLKRGTLQRKDQ